jgi:hypothetical protein
MIISSLAEKLSIVAVATLVTVAAGSAKAAYGDNGMAPPKKGVGAARNEPGVSGTARWKAAGIDPSRALGASLATK